MAYPVLAPNSSWFDPTNTSVKRVNITEIEIKDSYTPDASVTVTDSWDASAAKDGSITCYVIGTKLIIAGNGSGKIAANEDSSYLFSDANDHNDCFAKVVYIYGAGLLDVSNATTLAFALDWMDLLVSIDVSNWNTSNVTTIRGLCNFDYALKTLDVSEWDVSKVSDMNYTFQQCKAIETIDVSKWNVSQVTTMRATFKQCIGVKSIDVSKWDVSKVINMEYTFSQCTALTGLDLSLWNTGNVTSMAGMFSLCELLTTLGDVSNWNTSSCTNMHLMFNYCSKLQNLDPSRWDTSAVTDMTYMFYHCPSLGEIDVSNWDVSKVANFDHFAAHANLKRKGIENWKTTSATNMNALFHNCAEEELDLSGWDVSKNQFFCQMFENSPNLKRIKGLDKWNTSAGLGFDGMFERCSALEEVDLSSFNTTKAKNNVEASDNGHKTATLQNMFFSCNNLKKVKLGPNFSINGDGTNTSASNKLILPTPSTDYITGADGNWYAFNGDPYAPNAIQDRTAETYFASFPLCQNEDVIVKNGSLIDVAKAIKEKNGATAKYTPAQFGAAIRAL